MADYNFYYQKLSELGVDHNHVRANYQKYIIYPDLANTIGNRDTGEATCSSFKDLGDTSTKRSYDILENHIKFNRMKRLREIEKKYNGFTKADFSFRQRQLPPVVEESQDNDSMSGVSSQHKTSLTPLKMPAVQNSAMGMFSIWSPNKQGPYCDLSTGKKRINQRVFDTENSDTD